MCARALKAAEALDFVEAMPQGLDTPVGERGTALSGGQRQRLAIARALVHSPDLLVLDEATTALDPATETEICRTLRRLAGQRTILAISHQPRIAEIADIVVEVVRQVRARDGHRARQGGVSMQKRRAFVISLWLSAG